MYAIIETGGKQYRVAPGDILQVEKLDKAVGDRITFDKVLLVGNQGSDAIVGTPMVASASIEGEVVQQGRGEKILIIKYRRRKGYRKTEGHRQSFTRVLITKLSDGKGGSAAYDEGKRREILMSASIATSEKKKTKAAAKTTKTAAPKAAKATAKKPAKKA